MSLRDVINSLRDSLPSEQRTAVEADLGKLQAVLDDPVFQHNIEQQTVRSEGSADILDGTIAHYVKSSGAGGAKQPKLFVDELKTKLRQRQLREAIGNILLEKRPHAQLFHVPLRVEGGQTVVGIELADKPDGKVVAVRVQPGTPAQQAECRICAGDELVALDDRVVVDTGVTGTAVALLLAAQIARASDNSTQSAEDDKERQEVIVVLSFARHRPPIQIGTTTTKQEQQPQPTPQEQQPQPTTQQRPQAPLDHDPPPTQQPEIIASNVTGESVPDRQGRPNGGDVSIDRSKGVDDSDSSTGKTKRRKVPKEMVLTGEWTQVQSVELLSDDTGLGFGIVGGRSTGVVVKTVIPAAPANRDGRLRAGDHLLQINGIDLHGMSSQQVAMILRQQDTQKGVRLTVGRPMPATETTEVEERDRGCHTMKTKQVIDPIAFAQFVVEQPHKFEPLPLDDFITQRQLAKLNENHTPIAAVKEESEPPSEDKVSLVEGDNGVVHKSKSPPPADNAQTESKPMKRKWSSAEGCSSPAPSSSAAETSTPLIFEDVALSTFCRSNWQDGQVQTVDVRLKRDEQMGLGITVAGYVHRKEEISGVFVKNLVPLTAADRNGNINIHDLIVSVNGQTLEGLSHADSVRLLVQSGANVHLQLVRFLPGSSQAACLAMLREQESETQMIDIHRKEGSATPTDEQVVPSTSTQSTPPPDAEPTQSTPDATTPHAADDVQRASTSAPPVNRSQTTDMSDEEVKEFWRQKLGDEMDIVLCAMEKPMDGGLGLSLEGTVDVVNGAELRPHHYIQRIHPDGPAGKSGKLRSGDELLEVNAIHLFGVSHVDVRRAMSALPGNSAVRLVVARVTQLPVQAHLFEPLSPTGQQQQQRSSHISRPTIRGSTRGTIYRSIIKAKSEMGLSGWRQSLNDESNEWRRYMRSRSLEPLHGMAVWSLCPVLITLRKGVKGLGFSVLDYQDPAHKGETVIVVKSLVPGGVAHVDGRILPGDRLLYVNDVNLGNATLDDAVRALKEAPMGDVLLAVAKPLPLDDNLVLSHSPIISRSERLLAQSSLSSPRAKRKRVDYLSRQGVPAAGDWSAEARRRLYPQIYHGYSPHRHLYDSASLRSDASLNGSYLSMLSWSNAASDTSLSPAPSPSLARGAWNADVVRLPDSLEHTVRLRKGRLHLGLTLDCTEKGINGCVVKTLLPTGIVGIDGRVVLGDHITSINNETLRNVTQSQARSILKRASLIGNDITLCYIPLVDAQRYKERGLSPERAAASASPHSRLSPRSCFADAPPPSTHGDAQSISCVDSEMPTDDMATMRNERAASESVADDIALTTLHDALSDVAFTYNAVHDACGNLQRQSHERQAPTPPSSPLPEQSIEPEDVSSVASSSAVVPDRRPYGTEGTSPNRYMDDDTDEGDESRQWPPSVAPPPPPQMIDTPTTPTLELSSQESITPIEAPTPSKSSGSSSQGEMEVNEEAPTKHSSISSDSRASAQQSPSCSAHSKSETSESKRSSVAAEEEEGEKEETTTVPSPSPQPADSSSRHSSPLSVASESAVSDMKGGGGTQSDSESIGGKFWGDARSVQLTREMKESFGISIVGGRVEVSQRGTMGGGGGGGGNTVSGIFIKSVMPDSPAAVSQQLHMGDRIISVNEVDLRNSTHEQAVQVIRNAVNPVTFVVQSIHSFTPQQMMSATTVTTASITPCADVRSTSQPPSDGTHTVMSNDATHSTPHNDAALEQTPEAEEPSVSIMSIDQSKRSSMTSPKPIVRELTDNQRALRALVDERSAAALPTIDGDEEEEDDFGYTKLKLSQKYGADVAGELLVAKFHRRGDGIGLSLAGNRDRNKLSVFIIASKAELNTHELHVADEILEMNGMVIYGRSHLNASTMMRTVKSAQVHMVVARREGAVDEMAVKPDAHLAQQRLPIKSPSSPQCNIPLSAVEEHVVTPAAPATSGVPMEECRQEATTSSGGGGDASTERTVRVAKRPSGGFGLTLTEGTTTSSNESVHRHGVFVTHIAADNEANEDGGEAQGLLSSSVRVGDQVLAVNGEIVAEWESVAIADKMQAVTEDHVMLTVVSNTMMQSPASTDAQSKALGVNVDEGGRKKSSSASASPSGVAIEAGKDTLLEIDKGGHGLGLSIVGGSDTVLGTVVIHEVYPDGAAAKDARLRPGDQILEVNGQSLRDVSHEKAINMLRHTPSHVRLVVHRDESMHINLLDPTQIYNVIEVHLCKKPGKGLGMSIVGRKSEPGVYLSEVVKGGLADADGRLMQGDQILKINEQDVTNALQEEVAAILKTCTGKVHLKVGRWKLTEGAVKPTLPKRTEEKTPSDAGDKTSTSSATTAGTSQAVDQSSPVVVKAAPSPPSSASTESKPVTTPIAPPPQPLMPKVSEIKLIRDLYEEGCESVLVELIKVEGQTLGMGIGKRARGVLVTSVLPMSAAAQNLKVGDRLMAVNGKPVTDQASAVAYVKESDERLFLQIARPTAVDDSANSNTIACECVLLRRAAGQSFGFSITGGHTAEAGDRPITVKHVLAKGAAAESSLKSGDTIVAVNDQSLLGLSHILVVDALRHTYGEVRLTVRPSDIDDVCEFERIMFE